jgi:ACS family tartrate transporter-like MFS transporter
MSADERAIRRKLTLRLVAPLAVLFVINSLDRANVSFAALRMNADLNLSPAAYGLGASIFFAGYILFQAPHAFSQRLLGARLWICLTMLVWGAFATSLAFVQSRDQFYALRFLLGVAEGGFAPGVMAYLAMWAPRRYRGWLVAGTMAAIPVSVIIGAPLSGWLLQSGNPAGLAGWRWMFLIEGLPAVLLAGVAYAIFPNRPEGAAWLTEAERRVLREELEREHAEARAAGGAALASALAKPWLWISVLVWFGILTGQYGLMFWLPQAVKAFSHASDVAVGFITALPWIGIASGMLLNAWRSDVTGERLLHLAIPAAIAAACTAGAALESGPAALALITAGGFFLGAAQGAFWPIPTRLLAGLGALGGVTLINLCGNASGVVTPWAIGWVRELTGSFQAPIFAIAAVMLGVAFLMLPLRGVAGGGVRGRDGPPAAQALAE